MVVSNGVAIGLAIAALSSVSTGDQVYAVAPPANSWEVDPAAMVEGSALAVKSGEAFAAIIIHRG